MMLGVIPIVSVIYPTLAQNDNNHFGIRDARQDALRYPVARPTGGE